MLKAPPTSSLIFDEAQNLGAHLHKKGQALLAEYAQTFWTRDIGNGGRDPANATTATNQPSTIYTVLYVIGLLLFAFLVIFIQGFFIKELWNFTLPYLFLDPATGKARVQKITWLGAIALLILVRILFF